MIFRFEEGWIETKDSITVRALIALQEGRVVEALSSCILSWSEDAEVNTYNVGCLKAGIGDEILRFLLRKYNRLLEDRVLIERLAVMVVDGLRLADNEYADYYERLFYLMPCLSPWGGFSFLPEEGGILDQSAEMMVFLLALQKAFGRKKGR